MDTALPYLLFIAGIILLPIGAEVLIRGSVALAERAGISPLVVGLTVVAFGTSAPELVVSVNSALSGVPGIAIGNVIGSNIANILLILGTAAVLMPIQAEPKTFIRDMAILTGVTLIGIGAMWSGAVPRWQGIGMLVLLAGFLLFNYWWERRDRKAAEAQLKELEEFEGLKSKPMWLIIGAVIVGLIGVVLGADMLVNGAVVIARGFGVPKEVIGLTMVAIGTSLPELATAVAAAMRGQNDMAVGNIIGSNIFNILAILGTTAVITTVPVSDDILNVDIWVMLGATLLLIPFMLSGRQLSRLKGGLFLAAYVGYIAYLFIGTDRAVGM